MAGQGEQVGDSVGVAADVDAEDARLSAVHREEGGEHLQGGGLAGAVRAEHAEDLAAPDLEVDAVDRPEVVEGLDETSGRDGQVGVRYSCHGSRLTCPGFTAPSRRFQLIAWFTHPRKWSSTAGSPATEIAVSSPRRHSQASSSAAGPLTTTSGSPSRGSTFAMSSSSYD